MRLGFTGLAAWWVQRASALCMLDYAKPASVRHLLLGLVAASLLATAVWVLLILSRLHA